MCYLCIYVLAGPLYVFYYTICEHSFARVCFYAIREHCCVALASSCCTLSNVIHYRWCVVLASPLCTFFNAIHYRRCAACCICSEMLALGCSVSWPTVYICNVTCVYWYVVLASLLCRFLKNTGVRKLVLRLKPVLHKAFVTQTYHNVACGCGITCSCWLGGCESNTFQYIVKILTWFDRENARRIYVQR